MKVFKTTLFTGVMSDCYEFKDIENFKLLPTISPVDVVDLCLKNIGSTITLRKPTEILNRMINILHNYCNRLDLTFSVEEIENGELYIAVDDTYYIFDVCYLRIIIPFEYVNDYEVKES